VTSANTSDRPSSENLDQTAISAHLEAEITTGQNLLYCASFQVAWDQIVDDMVGEPLQLEGEPATAQGLNKGLVGKKDIAEDCYLAMAGFGRDGIVEQVKKALREKFNRSPGLDLNLNSPDDILAYAYLEKSIPFDTEFDTLEDSLLFSDGQAVAAFGVEEPVEAAAQVLILDYQHPDEFIIKLQASPTLGDEFLFGRAAPDRPRITDDIILAKVAPQATLRETVDTVLDRSSDEGRERARMAARRAGQGSRLLSPRLDPQCEVLRIPKIDLDVQHRYSELLHKLWLNEGFEEYRLSKAVQAIKFKLNEKGAELSSEAGMVAYLGVAQEPRKFIFDKPFLLCLKEREARYPYLAIWIDNSELLVKADGYRHVPT
jgi:hypothetical protein